MIMNTGQKYLKGLFEGPVKQPKAGGNQRGSTFKGKKDGTSILHKLIYRFSAMPIKISRGFYCKNRLADLKIYMEITRTWT